MLPRMSPRALPQCATVLTTLLRDPQRFYPSLQLHQFPAMKSTLKCVLSSFEPSP